MEGGWSTKVDRDPQYPYSSFGYLLIERNLLEKASCSTKVLVFVMKKQHSKTVNKQTVNLSGWSILTFGYLDNVFFVLHLDPHVCKASYVSVSQKFN